MPKKSNNPTNRKSHVLHASAIAAAEPYPLGGIHHTVPAGGSEIPSVANLQSVMDGLELGAAPVARPASNQVSKVNNLPDEDIEMTEVAPLTTSPTLEKLGLRVSGGR